VADKTVYSGTDIVGRTEEVNQQIIAQSVISKTFGGVIDATVIAIKRWLGIITRPTRSTSPLGALEAVKNFRFNKTMNAMSLRDGTTQYSNQNGIQEFYGCPGSTKNITVIDNFFPLSTESPVADTVDIICGKDATSNKHIFQSHFREGTGLTLAGQSFDGVYVEWGEKLTIGGYSEAIVDSYSEVNKDGAFNIYSGAWAGQTFTGDGSAITKCMFYMQRYQPGDWSGDNKCYAYLSAHSGTFGSTGVPGEVLATSVSVDATSVPTGNFQLVTFTFTTPYTTVAGTHYVITVGLAGGSSDAYLFVGSDASTPTHPGNAVTSHAPIYNAGVDVCFYVYGLPPFVLLDNSTTIYYQSSAGKQDNFASYWKGGIVRNVTRGGLLYIIDSIIPSYIYPHVVGLSVVGNVPNTWLASDTLIIYRSFHDNYSFVPTYSTVAGRPPVALQQGNALLFSGGMGSDAGLKPIWSGYLNKTFFVGATNKTGGINYTGTYVTEAEIKSTNGITLGDASEIGSNPLSVGRWFYCLVPETDDGERGNPIYSSTPYYDSSGLYRFQSTATIDFPQLNKRFRYLNVFAGLAPNTTDTTIDWSNLFYIERLDLLGSAWIWHQTDTTSNYTGTVIIDGLKWNNNTQETLLLHLGHTISTSTTASFSEAIFLSNRLFIARYYDYVDAVEYLDQIRFTDFAGNGKAQLNVLNNIDGFTQSTIEQGDSTSVRALRHWQDKLFIIKDKSCYYIPVTDTVDQWMLVTVSNTVGTVVPKTAVVTPTMVIWCQDGEDVYGWSGANVFSLGQNWLTTMRALNLASANSKGWYDSINKSYNFSDSSGVWHTMFMECSIPNGFIWGDNLFDDDTVAGNYNIIDVASRAGISFVVVYDTASTIYYILRFDPTATQDNLHFGIIPYFKTAESRLDETSILKLMKFYLSLNPTGGSGQLDSKLTIGSNVLTYSNMTKTLTLHSRGIPFTTNSGRSFQFEFNTNASRATFTGLEIYELHFDYEMLPFIGDNTTTI
jgi:hypothetical protein